MKQVLIYENRKIDPIVWDVSTLELRAKAFMALFKILDVDWEAYSDLDDECVEEGCSHSCTYHKVIESTRPNLDQQGLYAAAKDGNAKAAEQLLQMRRDYEYENWVITEMEEPNASP